MEKSFSSKDIRMQFLSFFESKRHAIVESAPMVIKDDPTLLFTNAGMNQFKDWFLGNTPAKYKRVTDTQKCLRVSGKHNDLEEVGKDSYHHTMFEMLGNWSFGDYFKKEAIEWAWELLTEVYKLDKERLYVTIFEGSKDDNIGLDEEAKKEWLKFIPEERIILGNKKDNFWEMGDTGPCGPCSEIHIDLRDNAEIEALSGKELVNKGHHLVIEIWNLVFIQFNRKADGSLAPLPQKHVDTGMGLERLCMAIQGKHSNYDTDVFTGMIAQIASLSGKSYGESEQISIAMRVIADHIRAISFSIADGQLPSNVKAGYVIRRILRRAVRYGYTFLEFNKPFMFKLVPTLVSDMGEAFPELKRQKELIEKVIKEEEEAFLRTLDKGIRLMDSIIIKNSGNKIISGSDAFILYDTFGFPIDLSALIAEEHGYSIDMEGFEIELQKQKERSRNATATKEGDWIELIPNIQSIFVGYSKSEENVRIARYRVQKTKTKELFQLVLDKSPFYAESGGQVGDTGYIISETGEKIRIINCIKENNLNIHICETLPSNPAENFIAVIDKERRQQIANNHSATHLLHHALREILGNHIEQKGSLVSDEYFRFDFSHFEKLTEETLRKAENIVNALIRSNAKQEEFQNIPIEKAKSMGAMALFGEKYGDLVRVIKFGDSTELCGGTHTSSTGNIGLFKILSESAIAAGVRRIEATTGVYAERVMEAREDTLREIKNLLNNAPDLVSAIKKVYEENEKMRKESEEIQKERANTLKKELISSAKDLTTGVKLISLTGEYKSDFVKTIAFMLRNEVKSCIFVAATHNEGKANISILFSDDLVARGFNAGKEIKAVASIIDGGGGGQPFFASAGGKNTAALQEALNTLVETLKERL